MTRIVRVDCPTLALTPAGHDCLFGFNDICPWSPSGHRLLVLRIPGEVDRVPDGTQVAELCLWEPGSADLVPLGATTAWNHQQGCRAQWLCDRSLIHNVVEEGQERAVVRNLDGEVVRTLPLAVYALAPDRTTAISPSFGRVHAYSPGYGYACAAPDLAEHAPATDGLWRIDLAQGSARLALSLADIERAAPLPIGRPRWVSHIWFSPTGEEFLFVHSTALADGGIFANLMIAGADGSDLRCVGTERISHPCWLDATTVAAWSRVSSPLGALRRASWLPLAPLRPLARLLRRWQGRSRNLVLREGLIAYATRVPLGHRVLARGAIDENGHFSMHPTRDLLVGDTYPDAAGRLHLFLYDLGRDIKIEVASFPHEVRWTSGYLRADLHPRWDRSGTRIAVDVSLEGVRRVAVLDVSSALAALDA